MPSFHHFTRGSDTGIELINRSSGICLLDTPHRPVHHPSPIEQIRRAHCERTAKPEHQ